MDNLKMHSSDFTQQNIARLAELFPSCVTEAKDESGQIKRVIDFDELRQELSESIVDGPRERYHLDWPGKKEAILAANAPIAKTLRPYRNESLDFDSTKNLFIEGDNLDALKLLQETYLNKIKMIYVDPPYNTGNDFIYNDDFRSTTEEYLLQSNQTDEEGNRLVNNPESNGRFHSDWSSMILPRLKLCRNLLRDDGLLFLSIDDHEIHNLRKLCDEVFGEDNFIGIFTVNSTPNARDYGHIGKMHEYVLFYAKNVQYAETNLIPDADKTFSYSDDSGQFNIHPLYNSNVAFHSGNRPNLYYPFYLFPDRKVDEQFFEIGLEKQPGAVEIYPPLSQRESVQFVWRWGKAKAQENLNKEIIGYRTNSGEYRVVQKMRHAAKLVRSLLTDTCYSTRRGTAEVESLFGKKVFSFPKPLELLKLLCTVGLSRQDVVLDMFAGSCTTAEAIFALNAEDSGQRSFIAIQLPERCEPTSVAYKEGFPNVAEIGKQRIRLAGTRIKADHPLASASLDTGFRLLRVDTSNMEDVYYAPDSVEHGDLLDQVENIKEDRTSEDLLFQVLLDWGVDLSLLVTEESIEGKTVFFVDGNALAACFDREINEELVKTIAARKPLRAVFRDSGYGNDSVKINVEQIFKLISPGTEVKSI